MLMEYRQFAPNCNYGNNTEPAVDRTFFFYYKPHPFKQINHSCAKKITLKEWW